MTGTDSGRWAGSSKAAVNQDAGPWWKGASEGRGDGSTEGFERRKGDKDSLRKNKLKKGEKMNKNGKTQLSIFILFEVLLIFPAKLSS